ncbi:hypothetical protein [Victivallis sp. Marseille-Q1083]|uniref:hypothetical protein n=1 Tax=Victivallis sp. Marseille-Q1083 TaxID=2717288 RepID=UPI001589E9C5|nr:hypothetical protein [Victivallis sp. Marseille-Q1083]
MSVNAIRKPQDMETIRQAWKKYEDIEGRGAQAKIVERTRLKQPSLTRYFTGKTKSLPWDTFLKLEPFLRKYLPAGYLEKLAKDLHIPLISQQTNASQNSGIIQNNISGINHVDYNPACAEAIDKAIKKYRNDIIDRLIKSKLTPEQKGIFIEFLGDDSK